MIYSLTGKLALKSDHFVIVEVSGIGLKVFIKKGDVKGLPAIGGEIKLFTHFHVREDSMDLYGFSSEDELNFFEMLNSVSGVGPRSALAILDISELRNLLSAIKENRPDLLTRASGIGRKIAERIILELKNKVQAEKSESVVRKMESDVDLAETLVSLGYRRDEAKSALSKVDEKVVGMEDRLKAALKILGRK